jgi:hypothetical protein
MKLKIVSLLVFLFVVSSVTYGGQQQKSKSDDPYKTYFDSYQTAQSQIADYLNNAKKRIQETKNYAKKYFDFIRLLNDIINEYKGEKKFKDLNNLTKNDLTMICHHRKGDIDTM